MGDLQLSTTSHNRILLMISLFSYKSFRSFRFLLSLFPSKALFPNTSVFNCGRSTFHSIFSDIILSKTAVWQFLNAYSSKYTFSRLGRSIHNIGNDNNYLLIRILCSRIRNSFRNEYLRVQVIQ